MTLTEAYESGYATYYAKGEVTDNPHSFEEAEELYSAWEEGFDAACCADWAS